MQMLRVHDQQVVDMIEFAEELLVALDVNGDNLVSRYATLRGDDDDDDDETDFSLHSVMNLHETLAATISCTKYLRMPHLCLYVHWL